MSANNAAAAAPLEGSATLREADPVADAAHTIHGGAQHNNSNKNDETTTTNDAASVRSFLNDVVESNPSRAAVVAATLMTHYARAYARSNRNRVAQQQHQQQQAQSGGAAAVDVVENEKGRWLQNVWELAPQGRVLILEFGDAATETTAGGNQAEVPSLRPRADAAANNSDEDQHHHNDDNAVDRGSKQQRQHGAADDNTADDTEITSLIPAKQGQPAAAAAAVLFSDSDSDAEEKQQQDNASAAPNDDGHATKLDALRATAIAGNDITSSCLYSTGLCIRAGGALAPLCTMMVVAVLYLFRSIYTESIGALPVNGATYTAILNCTRKWIAALAAILSLLSYAATATTSAASSTAYLHYEWPSYVPELPFTLLVIGLFAVLNFFGISESANVATGLFIAHNLCMAVLVVCAFVFVIRDDFSVFADNFRALSKNWAGEVLTHDNSSAANTTNWINHTVANLTTTTVAPISSFAYRTMWSSDADPHHNIAGDIFFGFSAALLGITGFETSANYVQEIEEGVFPKTLNYMWLFIAVLNPATVLAALGVIPLPQIVEASDYALAKVAEVALGPAFRTIVIVDATLVLSGAVLTAYVGVGGLLCRLAEDGILPRFFIKRNSWRGTRHFIIFGFCALCMSLRLLVGDNMGVLGGVYSVAFLGVMCLFCVACFMLKYKRATLKRSVITPPVVVGVALVAVFAGMIGNLAKSESNLLWFLVYFCSFACVVAGFMLRGAVLRYAAMLFEQWPRLESAAEWCRQRVIKLRRQRVVYFTTSGDIAHLTKVVRYIEVDEDARHVYIVHCTGEGSANSTTNTSAAAAVVETQLEASCALLDVIFPRMTVELVIVRHGFTPQVVDEISKALRVPKYRMFCACPKEVFFPQFVGLRVITRYTGSNQQGTNRSRSTIANNNTESMLEETKQQQSSH